MASFLISSISSENSLASVGVKRPGWDDMTEIKAEVFSL